MTPTEHLLSLNARGMRRNQSGHIAAEDPPALIGMKFALWAQQQKHFPTIQQVMTHWECSRASAFRWTAHYAEAIGIDVKTRHAGAPVHSCTITEMRLVAT